MTRGIRKGLTPEIVLDAAFAIVDAGGAEALTMRRLAAQLGVAAMAIYNHFPDRNSILDALADRAFAVSPDLSAVLTRSAPPASALKSFRGVPARESSSWRQRITAIVLGVHTLAVRHPHIYRLAITRPTKPESAVRLMSEAMAALRSAGLSEPQCVTVYHTIVMLMHGFPFWIEAMQRHCAVGAAFTGSSGTNARLGADWNLVHRVKIDGQFGKSLEWVLDAIEQSTGPSVQSRRAGRAKDAD